MSDQSTMELVNDLGKAITFSRFFGCENEHQGRVLAYSCVTRRKDPMTLAEEYNLIQGELSLKPEAMLARFKGIGGKYQIVEYSPDCCHINFSLDGQTLPVKITWEAAQGERWPYAKDGSIKANWETPISRQDMLWARVVSRGVRRLAPEVVTGKYTPGEIQDFVEYSPGDLVPIPAQPASPSAPSSPVTATATHEPAADPRPTQADADRLMDLVRQAGGTADDLKGLCKKFGQETVRDLKMSEFEKAEQRLREIIAAKAKKDQPAATTTPDPTPLTKESADVLSEATTLITRELRDLIQAYFIALRVPLEAQQAAVQKRGCKSIDEFSVAQAKEILEALKMKAEQAGVSPFFGTDDDKVDDSQIGALQNLVRQVAQFDPGIAGKIKAKLVRCGLEKIADLTVAEARELHHALTVREMEGFIDRHLEGWRKKAGGSGGQSPTQPA